MSQPLAVYDNDIVPAEQQLLSSLVTSQVGVGWGGEGRGGYTFPTNRCLRSITFLISNRSTAPHRFALISLRGASQRREKFSAVNADHLLAERRIKKISNRAPKEEASSFSLPLRSLVMRNRATDSGEGVETGWIDNDRSVDPGNVGRVITAGPNRTELLKCKLIGVRLTKQSPGGSGHGCSIALVRFGSAIPSPPLCRACD